MKLNEFVDRVGNYAVSVYNRTKILPSLCISQAIQESNKASYKEGQLRLSGLASDCHNYHGMKWTNGCGENFKEYNTKEQRSDGTYYTIQARFRRYETLEAGIAGYFKFLEYKRYQNLRGVTDYKRACELIREDGWATSLSYSKNLIACIEYLDLTRYDVKAIAGISMETECRLPTIRNGSTGKAVKIWQIIVNTVPDGIFGKNTLAETQRFQSAAGLEADGIVGKKTWKAGIASI